MVGWRGAIRAQWLICHNHGSVSGFFFLVLSLSILESISERCRRRHTDILNIHHNDNNNTTMSNKPEHSKSHIFEYTGAIP